MLQEGVYFCIQTSAAAHTLHKSGVSLTFCVCHASMTAICNDQLHAIANPHTSFATTTGSYMLACRVLKYTSVWHSTCSSAHTCREAMYVPFEALADVDVDVDLGSDCLPAISTYMIDVQCMSGSVRCR